MAVQMALSLSDCLQVAFNYSDNEIMAQTSVLASLNAQPEEACCRSPLALTQLIKCAASSSQENTVSFKLSLGNLCTDDTKDLGDLNLLLNKCDSLLE